MTTDVILLKQVPDLGSEGDKVSVKNGYARNFLLPQRIATLATNSNVRQLGELKRRRSEREAAELQSVRAVAEKITKITLSIPVQTGPGGKLFGAVTTHHITEALAKAGVTVEHRHVELKHAIHSLGTFDVDIRLHTEVTANLKFSVVSTNAPGADSAEAEGKAGRSEGKPGVRTEKRGARHAKAEVAATEEKPAEKPEKAEKKKKK